jgi:hypothetical protein
LVQVQLARAWLRGGNREAALASLQKAAMSGQVSRKSIETDVDLANLRDDPRWADLLRRAPSAP